MKKKENLGNPADFRENEPVMTTEEAMRYLRISKPTFLKQVRNGKIRASKVGNNWRVLRSELHRLLRGEEDS